LRESYQKQINKAQYAFSRRNNACQKI